MKTILSIVIPYYNAEKTISNTLASIDKMCRDNEFSFDVIIVDDGSFIPISRDLLHGFTYDVYYFKTPNNGPLLARCFGVKKSTSDYIYFLDADDELRETFFVDFCDSYREKQADIFLVDFFKRGNKFIYSSNRPRDIDEHYYIRHLVGLADLGYAVTQIFKKSFFSEEVEFFAKKNNVRFSEDLLFWISIFKENRQYAVLARPAYVYNTSFNSTSASFNYEKIRDIVDVLNIRYNFVFSHESVYSLDRFYQDVVAQICYLRKVISLHVKTKEKAQCLNIFQDIDFIDKIIKKGNYSLSLQNRFIFWVIKRERRHFLKHS